MSRSKLKRRKNAKRAGRVLASEIQQFERRSLLTGTVSISLVGSNLTVTGDAGNNDVRIEVSGNGGVTAQGVTEYGYNPETDEYDIPLNVTKLKVTVNGETNTYKAGEKVTLVDPEHLDAELVLGNLTVNMGAGNDVVEVFAGAQDEGDSAIDLLKLTGALRIDLGTGSDDAYVSFNGTNLEVVGAVSVSGGAGDDGIEVYTGNDSTATFKSTVTVDLGAGSDYVSMRWDDISIKGNELITTGDGTDYAYQSFNGSATLEGRLDIKTGNGDDQAYQSFEDDATLKSVLNIETGSGSDRLGVSSYNNAQITIKSNLTLDGGSGAGDDEVSVYVYNSGSSLTVLGDLGVKMGDGDNDVYLSVGDLTVGNTQSATVVAKNINIETGNDSDHVGLFVGLTVTGGVNIATGGGHDYVDVFVDDPSGEEPVEGFPGNTIGKGLTIDTANSLALLNANYQFDSRGGDDADSVYVGFSNDEFEIKGNLDIRTGNGGDSVYVGFNGDTDEVEVAMDEFEVQHTGGDYTIGGDLKVNAGAGGDHVGVFTQNSATLLVKGSADLNLGGPLADTTLDVDDCLVVGDEVSIYTALGKRGQLEDRYEHELVFGSFDVTKNFTIKGGQGDDVIGLAGIYVTGNLLVDADAGDDVVGGFDLEITGNLTINGGANNDSIGAQHIEVGGNTTIDAGSGDDTVIVDSATFGGKTVSVNMNSGNDNLVATYVAAGDGLVAVTVNGGAHTAPGKDNIAVDDSIDDDDDGVTVVGFEGTTVDAEAAQAALIAALTGCLNDLQPYYD